MLSFSYILVTLANAYCMVMFVYILMSWIPNKTGIIADIDTILGKICDPYLNIFRRFIPPIGGTIDISPIIAILLLQLVVGFVARLF